MPTLIQDDRQAAQALELLAQQSFVGWDSETTGLDPTLDGSLRLVQLASKGNPTYIFDVFALGREGKAALKRFLETSETVKLAHNAKFDTKFAKACLGVKAVKNVVCTQLGHIISECGQLDQSFALRATAWEFANQQVDKSEQVSDWSKPDLRPSQLEYAALDAEVLLDIWPTMSRKLLEQEQMYVAQLEFGAVNAVADLELNGILIHEGRWREQAEENLLEWQFTRAALQEMLMGQNNAGQNTLFDGAPADMVNPDSYPQLTKALTNMGVPLPIDPISGHPTTRNFRIEPLAIQWPIIKVLLDYRAVEKERSSYGLNWLTHINPFTGRVHASFHQIKAITGRMACSDPNIQQIPIRRDGGKKFRRCFIAGPGKKMVGADYSQFEYRILADLCNDPDFAAAFISGTVDFHTHTAMRLFNTETPDEAQRRMAKNNNFAQSYGAGVIRFALMAGISLEEAERIMGLDRQAFPKKHLWLDHTARDAVRLGYSRTRAGRLTKYLFDRNNKQEVALIQRNGKNTPVQGTNADTIKLALRLVNEALEPGMALVHVVHDEIILEADDSKVKRASELLKDCMGTAGRKFVKKIPVKVDVHVGPEWSK